MKQAESLLSRIAPPAVTRPTIAITSGKGGVGKSSVVANVAAVLAGSGTRVLLLDADFGLANLAVLLDVCPPRTLEDAVEGRCSLADLLMAPRPGLGLVPAGSGRRRLSSLSTAAIRSLLDGTRSLASDFDLMLVDTAAGISPGVLATLGWAERVVVILNDDPASFIDAYAVVKLVREDDPTKQVGILVNQASAHNRGERLQDNFSLVTERFLGFAPEQIGVVPHDHRLGEAVRSQRLVTVDEPGAPSSRALSSFADWITKVSPRRTTAAARPAPAMVSGEQLLDGFMEGHEA